MDAHDDLTQTVGDLAKTYLQCLQYALLKTLLKALLKAFFTELIGKCHGGGLKFALGDGEIFSAEWGREKQVAFAVAIVGIDERPGFELQLFPIDPSGDDGGYFSAQEASRIDWVALLWVLLLANLLDDWLTGVLKKEFSNVTDTQGFDYRKLIICCRLRQSEHFFSEAGKQRVEVRRFSAGSEPMRDCVCNPKWRGR